MSLDSVRHVGPSTIGINTLYRSKGKIPEVFLRGAGVPEPVITNMNSLISAMDPIQFYSLFTSYSTADQDLRNVSTPISNPKASGTRAGNCTTLVLCGSVSPQLGLRLCVHDQ